MLSKWGLKLSAAQRVYAAFFLYALALGGIYPRIAEIQEGMGVAEGALGMGLVGTALGTLISLTFGGDALERMGAKKVLMGAPPLVAIFYAMASYADNPLQLFLCLVPAGICVGAIEQIVNLEADRLEHVLGRRIMNRSHGFWSVGFSCAGLLGGVAAQFGFNPQAHMLVMVGVVCILVVLLLGQFEAAPLRPSTHMEHQPKVKFASPTPAIMVLVTATLAAMLMEGASIDWSAIYMRDVFNSSPFVGGLAVAAGASMQALARFFADRWVERFSPVKVARFLGLILCTGVCLITWATSQGMALLGFALMGIGTSAIFPLAMSAAARRTDRSAALNVAALAQISFVVFLLGPPLLGWVAESFGIRASFAVSLPLIGLSFWAAKSLEE